MNVSLFTQQPLGAKCFADYCKGYKPPGSGEITVSCTLPCLTHSCRALPLHEKAHMQCPAGMTEITLEKSQDKGLKQCNSVS